MQANVETKFLKADVKASKQMNNVKGENFKNEIII